MYISLYNSESLGNSKNTSLRQTFATSPHPLVAAFHPSALCLFYSLEQWPLGALKIYRLALVTFLHADSSLYPFNLLICRCFLARTSYSNTGFPPSYTRQYQRESKNSNNKSKTEEGQFTDIWYFSRDWRKR